MATRPKLTTAAIAVLVVVVAAGCGGRIQPGTTYTGDATYYTSYPVDGDGGNCMRGGTSVVGTMYAAMNDADYESARMCGGFVRAAGPNGSVVVQIVDRCPECQPGDIDFSPEAFDHLAPRSAGRVRISWQLISGPSSGTPSVGSIAFVVKAGSNPWWIGIQVRTHRNLIQSLEAQVGGAWQAIERQPYDYFVASSGLGPGPFTLRVTDIYGQQLVWSGVTLSPGAVQPAAVQFSAH